MTAIDINIRADRELEAQARSVLADLGIDMTTAFNAFLTQVVDKKALHLKAVEPKPAQSSSDLWPPDLTKIPQPGCMKGKIWMADDFDAPLEDFAEYM